MEAPGVVIPDSYLELAREKRTLPADSAPLRLFRWDFLEKFTHTPVQIVPLFWVPVALLLAVQGLRVWPTGCVWQWFPLMIALGFAVVWTLTEYVVHRHVFHSKTRWRWQEEAMFLIHGIHHVQPHTKTRLVSPLSVSIPVASMFYFAFKALFTMLGQLHMLYPFMAGFMLGYVVYDVLHYTLHHLPVKHPWLKRLRRHHLEHHYKDTTSKFGVSTEAWDHVFGTQG